MDPCPDPRAREAVLAQVLPHRDRIWAYLFAMGRSPVLADDLVQQTFLVVCAKWESFTPGTDALAWALRIARLEFLAQRPERDRRLVLLESEVVETLLLEEPREDPRAEDELAALRNCLAALDARGREAVTLRYREGLAGEDAARRLGLTPGAFYTLLTRVRQALRECVERRLARGETS